MPISLQFLLMSHINMLTTNHHNITWHHNDTQKMRRMNWKKNTKIITNSYVDMLLRWSTRFQCQFLIQMKLLIPHSFNRVQNDYKNRFILYKIMYWTKNQIIIISCLCKLSAQCTHKLTFKWRFWNLITRGKMIF